MDSREVVLEVQKAVEENADFSALFEAFEDGVRHEQDYWFVPVRLKSPESFERRFEIYARFARLEEYLQLEHHLKVVLLPVLSRDIA